MTRKHFRALAENLKYIMPTQIIAPNLGKTCMGDIATRRVYVQCVRAVAGVCKGANVDFRFDTFYTACGLTDDEINKLPM